MRENVDYNNDVSIDENSLDLEWLEQPELMMRYIRHAAEEERKRDSKKEELDFRIAELDKQVRNNPGEFDLAKATDSSVDQAIKRDEVYQKLSKGLVEAKYEARVARGAVQAIQDKKEALQELDRLHQLGWFPGPKSPRSISEIRKKKADEKQSNQTVAKNTKRKRESG